MRPIPIQTFRRLPGYYTLLVKLDGQGLEHVSSTAIAGILSLNDVVVRKDLAAVGENGGKPRTGYVVRELMRCIGACLGYQNTDEAVLVGAGRLGRALLSYGGFAQYGLKIAAAFDIDGGLTGRDVDGKQVLSYAELPRVCRRLGVQMGIITVPAEAAQGVCDLLVASGILAIWNFAPTHLDVPEGVFVHNENMALSLSLLSQHLTRQKESGREKSESVAAEL